MANKPMDTKTPCLPTSNFNALNNSSSFVSTHSSDMLCDQDSDNSESGDKERIKDEDMLKEYVPNDNMCHDNIPTKETDSFLPKPNKENTSPSNTKELPQEDSINLNKNKGYVPVSHDNMCHDNINLNTVDLTESKETDSFLPKLNKENASPSNTKEFKEDTNIIKLTKNNSSPSLTNLDSNESNNLNNTITNLINDQNLFLHCNKNGSFKKSMSKSNSAEIDRPVLHVQFDNGRSHSESTVPIRDPYSTPSSSLSSSSSSEDNSSIGLSEARAPDGGWGWVVVAASFMVNLIADGITFSFGVMYVEFLSYFGEGKSKTAWIGSLFMAMPLLSGPVASFLTDRYGCRKVTIVGSVLASMGFVISAFANSMEVLFFTFGILAGFGLSLCYVAAVVIVAYYFDKKRSFATGLSVCGSGIGTFIFAPLIQALLGEYGWRGTTLILAGFFLNLAVCGALMRDLPWTSTKNKIRYEEKKRTRQNKRCKKNGSSVDTFSVSTNTAVVQPLIDNKISDDLKNDDRLFSSLVNLPTYVRNGEKVPVEVLELLSTNKNVYNVLLHNYPGLLTSSRSFSDSGRLNENHVTFHGKFVPVTSPLASEPTNKPTSPNTDSYLGWLKKTQSHTQHLPIQRKLPAYLKDLRMHRSSLTYRGAMLNIHRYRLRASSCPNIYRNSMTTIAKEKSQWYAGLWEFWDLLVDMLDFSHFADPRFLLFAISNFLLYTWYDVPYVYLTDNAVEMGFSESQSSYLIAIVGIVNMVGEILLGWMGDKTWVNPSLVYAVCMGLCGAITAMVPLISSYWSLCSISGAFGFFIAANYSLTSIILVELITLEKFTNAYGLLLLVQGVANLVGPPLAGWLYDITGTYDLSFYLAGFFIAMSGVLLVIIPATKRYRYFQTLQRQASNVSESSVGVDCSSVKEPQFHSILASCITGSVDKHKNEINHV